jgi:hypothetical protein
MRGVAPATGESGVLESFFQPLKLSRQVATAVEVPVLDKPHEQTRRLEIPDSRQRSEGDEITGILRPSFIIPGQQLEGDSYRRSRGPRAIPSLGAWPSPKPLREQFFDFVCGQCRVVTRELEPHHAFAGHKEIHCGPKARRDKVFLVLHPAILPDRRLRFQPESTLSTREPIEVQIS